jgi:hypothetical protein
MAKTYWLFSPQVSRLNVLFHFFFILILRFGIASLGNVLFSEGLLQVHPQCCCPEKGFPRPRVLVKQGFEPRAHLLAERRAKKSAKLILVYAFLAFYLIYLKKLSDRILIT